MRKTFWFFIVVGLSSCTNTGEIPTARVPAHFPGTTTPVSMQSGKSIAAIFPTSTKTMTITPTATGRPPLNYRRPTRTAPATPEFVKLGEGRFTLNSFPTEMLAPVGFDLDTGKQSAGPDADLRLWTGCGTVCTASIEIGEGSTQFTPHTGPLRKEDCTAPDAEYSPYSILYWDIGDYFCVRTNGGNISLLKLLDYSFKEEPNFSAFYFVTWSLE